MHRFRVVIADDEPPARAKVRRFLADDPEVAIVGEAESGPEAVALVERERPDLLFLDVQMPGADGFGVLAALPPEVLPRVVFVTAYDAYAIRAFDVHAVDYLLKPFDEERFQTALERAKAQLRKSEGAEWEARLQRVLDEARPSSRPLERILVRRGETAHLLPVERVDWLEAEDNYVRLHSGGESYLVRGTLAAFEARLDPTRFARIHRSHIVHLDRIRTLHPWSHGDWLVTLHDGTELMLSRRYRDRLPGEGV
jgi:two-component system LytT family response regulator